MKSIHKVVNGKLTNADQLVSNLDKFEGKVVTIDVKLYKAKRSNNQNSYYWSVIVPLWKQILADEWGELRTLEQTHEFLKYNCNYDEKVNEDTGEVFKLSKSTTKNNTKEQEMFHEKCRQLAYENFNIVIPLPNEQAKIDLL